MLDLQDQHIKLSFEAKRELHAMVRAHDYYNDALQDLEDDGDYLEDEEDLEEDEDEEDLEEDEDEESDE